MADPIKIYQTCGKCHGDGQFPNAYINFQGEVVQPESTEDCINCGGRGTTVQLLLDEDFAGMIEDALTTLGDIKEKVDEIKDVVDAL